MINKLSNGKGGRAENTTAHLTSHRTFISCHAYVHVCTGGLMDTLYRVSMSASIGQ